MCESVGFNGRYLRYEIHVNPISIKFYDLFGHPSYVSRKTAEPCRPKRKVNLDMTQLYRCTSIHLLS